MPIVPDTKNWTWVLERSCPECGFDTTTVAGDDVAPLIRGNVATWQHLLEGGEHLTERPSDDRWSALEYACHVRDVFRLYDERLHLMLDQDDPRFPDWDQDKAAVDQAYHEQEPRAVVSDLVAAGEVVARSFDEVAGSQWQRTGTRSDGARFTVETFARYFIHDPIHHVWDVEQGFEVLSRRGG